jgi:hypothetical protein
MTEHLISVKDFAEQNGLLRPTVFKVLKRLEIEPSKSRGGNRNRGQTTSYITQDDARRILEALASTKSTQNGQEGEESDFTEAALYDVGVFYLLSLEPEHDPTALRLVSQATLMSAFANIVTQLLTCKLSKHGRAVGSGKKPLLSALPKAASGGIPKFSELPLLRQSRKNVKGSLI